MRGLALALAAVALAGCGNCGGSGTDAGVDAGPPQLSLIPTALAIDASGSPVPFRAVVRGSGGTVSWSLSPALGSLSATTGLGVAYTPPPSVAASSSTTLTAALDPEGLTAQAQITVNPGGSLDVVVTAPPLLAPSVIVSGPNGFQRTLPGTALLAGVDPGTYTVDALVDRVPGPLVDAIQDPAVSGSPAVVPSGGSATVNVAYARRGGTGALWIPSPDGGRVAGYAPLTLLGDAGMPTVLAPLSSPNALAVDGNGALWAVDAAGRTVSRYPPSRLAAGGTPDWTLGDADAGLLPGPVSLAFDAAGNLWVANRQDVLAGFSAASLDAGLAMPFTTVLAPAGSGPSDLTFDAFGNLWVAYGGSGRVVELTGSSAWMGTVTPAPAQTLGPLAGLRGIAFDSAGSLWVALGNEVVAFSPIPGGGGTLSPDAGVALSGVYGDGGLAFSRPAYLAFDNSGDLWLTTDDQVLLEYAPARAGAAPSTAVYAADWTRGGKPAFDPPPLR